MNPDQASLWHRIQAHPLDDSFAACPFSLRLAKENAWRPGFTQRVIEEYRRFAFLAVAAGHPVSPSDAVDQAWHLHLLYTRDYWGDFCPNILRLPLHHGPTRGGVNEHEKFTDWYGRTLASYRLFFGEPPADIWPALASHPEAVRIDPARHWVIPKPRWRAPRPPQISSAPALPATPDAVPSGGRLGSVLALGLLASAAWPTRAEAASVAVWPFDLAGPAFLQFYAVLMVGAFVAAFLLRRRLRQPVAAAEKKEMLDGAEAAYLAGGPGRCFGAGVVGAVQRQLIEVNKGQVKRTAVAAPANLPLIERAICSGAQLDGSKLRRVRGYARDAIGRVHSGLVEQGLVVNDAFAWKARLAPALVMAAVLTVGAAKFNIGRDLGRPVGWLMVLMAIVTVVMLVFLLRRPRLSRRGERVLANLRGEYATLESIGQRELRGNEPALLLPMAVGLFGASALQGTPLFGLEHELGPLLEKRDSATSSACSSGCGGGGSCGGGDGGGCGGCGGD